MAKKKDIQATLLDWSYNNKNIDKKFLQVHKSMTELAKVLQTKGNTKK